MDRRRLLIAGVVLLCLSLVVGICYAGLIVSRIGEIGRELAERYEQLARVYGEIVKNFPQRAL